MSFSLADSNRGRIAIIPEVTYNVLPASPNFQIIRAVSADFSAQKETIVSNELRSDRMVGGMNEVAATSGGTLNFEFSLGDSYKSLIEAALCGTLSTSVTRTNVAAASPANTFSAGTIGTNISVGQWVFASGFTNAANNGWHRVTASSAGSITVASNLVTEAAAAPNTVTGQMVRNGTVRRSYSVEEAFLDVGQFFLFRGQRVGSWSLEASVGQMMTGSFGFQGAASDFATSTFSSALTAATSTNPINGTSNVGSVLESTTFTPLTTALQSFRINVDNSLRNQMAIGSKFPAAVGYGRQTVSGSITAYFADTALYAKFLNHQLSALSFSFSDGTNQMRITIPRVYFSSGAPTLPGIDQDVMLTMDFTAIQDPTSNSQIQVDFA